MNIRRQLCTNVWISGAVMVLGFTILFVSARQVDLALKHSSFAASIIEDGVSGLRAVAVDYVLRPHQRALAQWQQRHASLRALLAAAPYAKGSTEHDIAERLRLRNAYLGEIMAKLAKLYAEHGGKPRPDDLRHEVEARLATQIMVATQDMVADASELLHRSHNQLRQVQHRANLIVPGVVTLMGLLVFATLVLVTRNVLSPIQTLRQGIERIGAGDLGYRTGIALDNEIGELARTFDAMAAQLARAQADMEANALRLQETAQELESFSYSVSHDLRAPLRGIDGWSLALQEDYGAALDATGRQYLDVVRAEAQRMGQLIDDLLQLSRVTRGELRREPVDLSRLAETVARRLTHARPERQIEFRIEPGLVTDADPRLLEIALTNLLGNAFKFSGQQPTARVEVGSVMEQDAETNAQRKVFFVRDNGVGFDMIHASKLFGAFQRLHAAKEFPGTGIGLATVQRIVRRHGGSIRAEAQPGQGASFYFTLEETA